MAKIAVLATVPCNFIRAVLFVLKTGGGNLLSLESDTHMSIQTLPSGYRSVLTLKLKGRNKSAIAINILAAVAVIPLLILGFFLKPIGTVYASVDLEQAWLLLLHPIAIILGIGIYTLLREGFHGLLIKFLTISSPTFGFFGLCFYASGDKQLLGKKVYILLSLGPSVLLFFMLLILNITLPSLYFWIIYFIQIVNIAGMVGDIYMAYIAYKMPKDLLVRDRGVDITFYSRENVSQKTLDFSYISKIWKNIAKKLLRKKETESL